MELSNLFLHILKIVSPRLEVGTRREVLRDFVDCGQLGDEDKRECIWGCEWEENSLYPLDYDEKFEVIFQQISNIGMKLH